MLPPQQSELQRDVVLAEAFRDALLQLDLSQNYEVGIRASNRCAAFSDSYGQASRLPLIGQHTRLCISRRRTSIRLSHREASRPANLPGHANPGDHLRQTL